MEHLQDCGRCMSPDEDRVAENLYEVRGSSPKVQHGVAKNPCSHQALYSVACS
jgi:hypothetical protein